MKKLIIGLVLAISPLFILAHNPLSASYYLEAGERVSALSINLSQAGIDQVLLKKYGAEAVNKMEQKAFKELIVAYLKDNFYLSVNGQAIELQEGGIKLGSHQTDLKFVLPALGGKIEELAVHIPAFQENDHHQTIFTYNLFGKKDKVILGANNGYEARIRLKEKAASNISLWPIWMLLLLTTLASMMLVTRKSKQVMVQRAGVR